MAGVTVRTLHHYEQIGLLAAAGRSPSGYRVYDDVDLERLQQILFYREWVPSRPNSRRARVEGRGRAPGTAHKGKVRDRLHDRRRSDDRHH